MNTTANSKFISRLQKVIETLKENSFITATELAKQTGIHRISILHYVAWLMYYDIVDVKKVGNVKLIMIKDDYKDKFEKLKEDLSKKGILKILV